jgi:hypothetical protein
MFWVLRHGCARCWWQGATAEDFMPGRRSFPVHQKTRAQPLPVLSEARSSKAKSTGKAEHTDLLAIDTTQVVSEVEYGAQ